MSNKIVEFRNADGAVIFLRPEAVDGFEEFQHPELKRCRLIVNGSRDFFYAEGTPEQVAAVLGCEIERPDVQEPSDDEPDEEREYAEPDLPAPVAASRPGMHGSAIESAMKPATRKRMT